VFKSLRVTKSGTEERGRKGTAPTHIFGETGHERATGDDWPR